MTTMIRCVYFHLLIFDATSCAKREIGDVATSARAKWPSARIQSLLTPAICHLWDTSPPDLQSSNFVVYTTRPTDGRPRLQLGLCVSIPCARWAKVPNASSGSKWGYLSSCKQFCSSLDYFQYWHILLATSSHRLTIFLHSSMSDQGSHGKLRLPNDRLSHGLARLGRRLRGFVGATWDGPGKCVTAEKCPVSPHSVNQYRFH